MYQTLLLEKKDHVLRITLNRPDVRNAFNEVLIQELTQVFEKDAAGKDIRVVLLQGAGKVFSAGGDLNWMKQSAAYTRDQNIADAQKLGHLLKTMNELSKPLVGLVHGAALGGGMGLVSVCDFVIATEEAQFGFTETRLGLIPAIIGPFVISKIGQAQARALFITAELFSSRRAYEIGLVHRVVPSTQELEKEVSLLISILLSLSPHALKAAKSFIHSLEGLSLDQKLRLASQTLADLRASPEGQEGIKAFLEKRKPVW